MNGSKRAISSWPREKKLIYELADEFQLSEDNINRAKEWSSSLKNTTMNEMRSIQFKIEELWQKLNIENNCTLKHLIQWAQELTTAQLESELKRFKK